MGSGEKEWKEFNNQWEAQERVNERKRVKRYKANLILWVTKRSSESAKKDIGEETAEADVHHISPTLPTEDRVYECAIQVIKDGVTESDPEDIRNIGTTSTIGDKVLKPDTDESVVTNPIETTTSKVVITLPQNYDLLKVVMIILCLERGVYLITTAVVFQSVRELLEGRDHEVLANNLVTDIHIYKWNPSQH